MPLWHPVYRDELLDRSAARPGRAPRPGARPVGGAAGDLAPGSLGMPRGESPRHAVQRAAVRAGGDAARRERPAGRRSGEAGGAGALDACRARPAAGERESRIATSASNNSAPSTRACSTTARDWSPQPRDASRAQSAPPCRSSRRPTRPGQRRQEGHRHVLHAARRSRRTWCGARWLRWWTAPPPTRSSRSASSIPRWAAARSWWPPAATSPPRTNRRSSPPAAATRATSRMPIAACSAGSSRSAACTASIGIPIAVQLARLSLWLCTLAPDRPLTFLDHRLLVGDSLIGAAVDDVGGPPPGATRRRSTSLNETPLPLFDADDIGPAIRDVLPARQRVASVPDESLAVVREKERILATHHRLVVSAVGVEGGRRPVVRVRVPRRQPRVERAASTRRWPTRFSWDVHRCPQPSSNAGWPSRARRRRPAGSFTGRSSSRRRSIRTRARRLRAPASTPSSATRRGTWSATTTTTAAPARRHAPTLTACSASSRSSGVYRAQGDGHANLYQLFVERAFRLTRAGGRMGLVVPWGLASDAGCAGLRRLLLDRSRIDSWIGFENTSAIFPIHRSVRFLLMTASVGGRTDSLPCRLGERDPDDPGFACGVARVRRRPSRRGPAASPAGAAVAGGFGRAGRQNVGGHRPAREDRGDRPVPRVARGLGRSSSAGN